jgi:formate C-acetyltransferase
MAIAVRSEGQIFHDLEDIYGVNVLTERVKKRKQAFMDEPKPRVDSARSHLATESWKETEGEHIYMRRARVFARICEGMPIGIFDDELIVGNQTRYVHGCSLALDWSVEAAEELLAGMRNVARGEAVQCIVSDDDLKIIEGDLAYWKGKTPEEILTRSIDEYFGIDYRELIAPGIATVRFGQSTPVWPHSGDYGKVLNKGLKGIIEEIEEKVKALNFAGENDSEKWFFYKAVILTLKAAITFAKRHAELARESAAEETNSARKQELGRIAEICERVPENPARNFYEAVQSLRFMHLLLNMEGAGFHDVPGRLDQYFFPFYERDIREGKLTVQEAAEILACFWLKLNEMDCVRPGIWKVISQGEMDLNITLGGVDREGNDATNELSYLMLKVTQELKLPINVYVRVNEATPDEFLVKAIEANRAVAGGIPAFMGDKRVIANFVEDGVAIEDAREYAAYACVHQKLPHTGIHFTASAMNGPKLLELVMYNGYDPRTERKLGLETGDPRSFTSIEDWIEAYEKQFKYWFDRFHSYAKFGFQIRGQLFAFPFNSAIVYDCLDKGLDVLRGGARYNQTDGVWYCHPRANSYDGLMAIKKLVYDEKKITVDELLDACAHNFEGNERREQIQQMLLSAPKYGNDDDEPDEIARRLSFFFSGEVRSHPNPWGYPTNQIRHGGAIHILDGSFVGATPDGRKAWRPLSDGGISPMRGADKKGPTAVLRSAAKIVDIHTERASVLNQKFSPALINTRENIMKVVSMLRTFFEDYMGNMIQYNIVSNEQLLDAKAHPEQYRDLVVRIGGYSAYFVELSPELQDEVIARTAQEF